MGNRLWVQIPYQGAIFQHPVVIDAHGDEHEVTLARGVESRDHVADETEPWLE